MIEGKNSTRWSCGELFFRFGAKEGLTRYGLAGAPSYARAMEASVLLWGIRDVRLAAAAWWCKLAAYLKPSARLRLF
jgi:hypothetical protein